MIIKKPKNTPPEKVEIKPQIWLPAAQHFGNLLEDNSIRYAIFGAGALAVHNVMVRPTVDVDYVVDDYQRAVDLLKKQPDKKTQNLEKERDGIQVADFYFNSGVTVQIWDNNLYSLPMTDESWSRVVLRPVPGYDNIRTIAMEDLIISKVGRFTQQIADNQYESNKNVRDIVTTMQTITQPDFKYVVQRLKEGARREHARHSSKIHPLDWYFVREVEIYRRDAEIMNHDKIGAFIAKILVTSKSTSIEYELLHSLRRNGKLNEFQSNFMLDDKALKVLLQRWKSILKIDGNKVSISSKKIQEYVETLGSEEASEYAKKIIYSGKKHSGDLFENE